MSKYHNQLPKDGENNGEHKNVSPSHPLSRPTISQGLKQRSKVSPTRNVSSEPEHRKKEQSPKTKITKPVPRKIQVGNRMRGGVKVIQSSGDFLGRLGTLVVMVVTMISTGVVTVSSFVEGVYWKFGLLAALLLFVHLPVTIAMIWMMCKARVKSIYKKVRPVKPGGDQTMIVEAETEENQETFEADNVTIQQTSTKTSDVKNSTVTHRGSINRAFEGDK